MRAFFIFEERNLQVCLRDRDFLKFVEVCGLLLNAFVQNRVREGEEAGAGANFLVYVPAANFLEAAIFSGMLLPSCSTYTQGQIQLADLFLQSHPTHQVVYATLDWLVRVQINGLGDCACAAPCTTTARATTTALDLSESFDINCPCSLAVYCTVRALGDLEKNVACFLPVPGLLRLVSFRSIAQLA